MGTEFEIATSTRESPAGPVRVLSLRGELDAHTMRTLMDRLEELHEGPTPRIVLDCRELEYISSAGLGVLNKMTNRFREKEGDLRLAALPEKIASIVDLLGFSQVIGVHASTEEAVQAFGG